MSLSQRVSRGFHRLGVLIAAVLMLIGIVSSAVIAVGVPSRGFFIVPVA